jgi:DNA topoisomerase VI subunit A
MPSKATRHFLRLFANSFPHIPLYGLFDADPDGVGIFSEYKYGSAKSARENFALGELQLLGLSISDVQALGVLEQTKLPLTPRDRTRISNLLLSEIGQNDEVIRSRTRSVHRFEARLRTTLGAADLI